MNCNDGLCSVGWLADEIGLVGSMNENENEMRTRGIGQYVHSDLDSDSGKARIKRSQKTTKKKGKKKQGEEKPEEKKKQRVRPISYPYTQRVKGNSRGKEMEKSAAPRRPFVRSHCFELAGGMNNAFRHSTSNASAAVAIAVYGVYRMSWCTSPIRRIGVGRIHLVEENKSWYRICWVEENRVGSSYLKKKKHSISISTSISIFILPPLA